MKKKKRSEIYRKINRKNKERSKESRKRGEIKKGEAGERRRATEGIGVEGV